MKIARSITNAITKDLVDKIIMVGGPRQVGKTTLAKSFLKHNKQYLSWDDLKDRALIKSHQINSDLKIVVLDEIHKYARWRTLLKGLFDKYQKHLRIIVTGSARLDYFRKGGDSLFGRFFYFRLHPLTLRELPDSFNNKHKLERLLTFGGFPEPFLKQNLTFLRRWHRERVSRVINQDVKDLSLVKEITLIEVLADLLPNKVGSLLSIKSLQEDLEVSPNTVANWIKILEQVYYCYRIYPYGPKKIRAVRKAAKLYLWDWSELKDPGARWENFIAGHLLKYCHYREDAEGVKMELRYLRDIDGREVDFIVLQDSQPLFAVECKTGDKNISDSIRYYQARTIIPKFYQVHLGTKNITNQNIRLLPFAEFCEIEKIP